MRLPSNIRFVLFLVLPAFAILYFAVSFLAPSDFESPQAELEFWKKRKVYFEASLVSLDILKEDMENPRLHHQFLENYTKLDSRNAELLSGSVSVVFGDIKKYYDSLLFSQDKNINAIGFYGHWKLKTYIRHPMNALENFQESDSLNLQKPYLNELRGDIFGEYDPERAISHYEKELELYPENKSAKMKLFRLVLRIQDNGRTEELLDDAEIQSESSLHQLIRYYYFRNDPVKWLASIHVQNLWVSDPLVVLNAFIVFLVWLSFLLYINVFKEIESRIFILCGLLSIVSIPLVDAMYDSYYFTGNGDRESGIFRENFIVGLFEESTKIIFPLIVSLLFSGKLKSPFSVMILFSLSSLIFALFENMLYFGNYFDLSIVSVRAIYSVALHLCAGTIAGYGYLQYEFRGKSIFYLPLTFMIAVFLHMMYDVIAGSFVYMLNIPLVIIAVFVLVSIYNNVLNNSPGFDHSKEARLNGSGKLLIIGLSSVMMIEFISISFRYGFHIGNITFQESLLSYGWLILVFASPVSNFKLVKDKWSFIDLGGMKTFDNLSNEIMEIQVTPIGLNAASYRLKIIGTVRADSEKKWFHCLQENTGEYYLVNFKEEGDHLIDSKVILFVLKAEKEIPHAFNAKSYPYLGMVFSSPVINP